MPSLRAGVGMLGVGLVAAAVARNFPAASEQAVEHRTDGVALTIGERRLEVRVCRDEVVRVLDAHPGRFFDRESIVTVPGACRATAFELEAGDDSLAVITRRLVVRIARSSGALTFYDREGRTLLAEKKDGRSLVPSPVMGEARRSTVSGRTRAGS